jgi:DNA-binding response OmpR family regulator
VPAIRKKGYRVEVARSGKEALLLAPNVSPDIVVVNAASLRTNGKRICNNIRSNLENCPIILIHQMNENYNGELDVDSLLILPFTARKLMNRIKVLVPEDTRKHLRVGHLSLDTERNIVHCEGRQARLTPKLAQLLEKFMRHPGDVLVREDLFSAVWQTEYIADTRTLDVHISWLRQAIEEDPRHPKYIKTIRGVGYRLDSQ